MAVSGSPALRLASDLTLPLATVTEPIAIVGIRGSGKTNTGVDIAEELLEHGQQVVIIDPTDVWWGLKSSADGTAPGYPVVVLGGRRADLPLAAGDGATIADFVVEHRASVICSLRHFESKAAQRRFVTEFASRLYFRKGQEGNETPLMLIIDEASLFVPQRVGAAEAPMVGAIQQLVRQGRSSGFGVTLIDQRPASVNKDVLTQLELLVCHRTVSPQDRDALGAWVVAHDTAGRGPEFLKALASLPQGTAYFWSPGWLDLFAKVAVRRRRTFDSSRTPKPGERVVAPARVAQVDLEGLKAKLAATVERSRADDPKALRARIAELERELKAKAAAPAPVPSPAMLALAEQRVRAATRASLRAQLVPHTRALAARADALRAGVEDLEQHLRQVIDILADEGQENTGDSRAEVQVGHDEQGTGANSSPGVGRALQSASTRGRTAASPAASPSAGLSRPQQRILDALAAFEALGLAAVSKSNAAVFSDASPTSSSFANNLGTLRSLGLIDYPGGGTVALTVAGSSIANAGDTFASLEQLHAAWIGKLSGPQGRILQELVRRYPRAVERAALAERVEASATSSSYANNLGALRSLGLIDYRPAGHVVATDLLFPEGLS